MHIKTGDEVLVITGKDHGKRGKIKEALPKENRVVVEGLNMIKRHTKARGQGKPSGIIEREAPIHASNVMLLDPETNEPTRVGIKVLPDGRRVRIGRKSGATVDKRRTKQRAGCARSTAPTSFLRCRRNSATRTSTPSPRSTRSW